MLLISVDVSGFRFKVKPLVAVVLVDATGATPPAPGNFNPNPKVVPPSVPDKVDGAPNETPVGAVEVEAFENEVNCMVLELVVAATVDAGANP